MAKKVSAKTVTTAATIADAFKGYVASQGGSAKVVFRLSFLSNLVSQGQKALAAKNEAYARLTRAQLEDEMARLARISDETIRAEASDFLQQMIALLPATDGASARDLAKALRK